jgi:hypothetical protein
MSETVTVQLYPRDRVIAQREAKRRTKSFDEDPVWDLTKNTFGVDALDRAYRGAMGELAFAKYAGLTIDADEYRRTDPNDDFHVEYQGGRYTIDVKTANKKPYALMVKEGTVGADYYVQGHLDKLVVTFYGMASGEEVRAQELVETPYNHCNHEIAVEELDPIPEPEALKPVGSN